MIGPVDHPNDVVMAGQQQILHHVKDEQRAHSVIGKALPHLGGEQEGQAARMAEKIALGGTEAIGAWQRHDLPNTKTDRHLNIAVVANTIAFEMTEPGYPCQSGVSRAMRAQELHQAEYDALLGCRP
jgi:hypothetical protein